MPPPPATSTAAPAAAQRVAEAVMKASELLRQIDGETVNVNPGLINHGLLPSGKHTKNYGKSPFKIGKSTTNGLFSIAMLVFQRVIRGYSSSSDLILKWYLAN